LFLLFDTDFWRLLTVNRRNDSVSISVTFCNRQGGTDKFLEYREISLAVSYVRPAQLRYCRNPKVFREWPFYMAELWSKTKPKFHLATRLTKPTYPGTTTCSVMPQLRQIIASFSTQRPRFDPTPVYVVNKMAQWPVFPVTVIPPCSVPIHPCIIHGI